MHYILEAFIVGLYTCFIYSFIIPFSNKFILFFCVGFFKHFFSYFLYLQTYYCNYGYACGGKNVGKKTTNITILELFIQSIMEGFLFIIFGSLLYFVIFLRKNKWLLFFMVGFILHIIFELLGIHIYFCKYKCSKSC